MKVKGTDAVVAESPAAGEEFVMEQGGPIKAFGVALKDMKKGETASLIVAPECEAPSMCLPLDHFMPISRAGLHGRCSLS